MKVVPKDADLVEDDEQYYLKIEPKTLHHLVVAGNPSIMILSKILIHYKCISAPLSSTSPLYNLMTFHLFTIASAWLLKASL